MNREQALTAKVHECPEAFNLFLADVQWLERAGVWLVTVQRGYMNDGVQEYTNVWQQRYSRDEVLSSTVAFELGVKEYLESR